MIRPRLLVTDVDGTLVRHDRTLAPSTIAAARRLRQAGVALALVSSRPPGGVGSFSPRRMPPVAMMVAWLAASV